MMIYNFDSKSCLNKLLCFVESLYACVCVFENLLPQTDICLKRFMCGTTKKDPILCKTSKNGKWKWKNKNTSKYYLPTYFKTNGSTILKWKSYLNSTNHRHFIHSNLRKEKTKTHFQKYILCPKKEGAAATESTNSSNVITISFNYVELLKQLTENYYYIKR